MPKGTSKGKGGGAVLENVSIAPSSIEGLGAFTDKQIRKGAILGTAFMKVNNTGIPDIDFRTTDISRHTTHSKNPNVKLVKKNENEYEFQAVKHIRKGQELRVDYNQIEKVVGFEGKRSFKEVTDLSLKNKSEKPESPHIYVIGYSGSGKSTYSKQLAKKLGIQYLSTDKIEEQYMKKILKPDAGKMWWREGTPEQKEKAAKLTTKHIEDLYNKRSKSVVEGIFILDNLPHVKKEQVPVYIMPSGLVKSAYRATRRDVERDYYTGPIKYFVDRIQTNLRIRKEITKFGKDLNLQKAPSIESITLQNKSEKYTSFNLPKFESGKQKQLYVTGYSGSGKTTLAKSLSKKYGALHLEMDKIGRAADKAMPKQLQKVKEKNRQNAQVKSYYKKAFRDAIHSQKGKVVIEGVEIPELTYDRTSNLGKKSIVVMDTSFLKSAYRQAVRDEKTPLSQVKRFIGYLPYGLSEYQDRQKLLKDIRKTIADETK